MRDEPLSTQAPQPDQETIRRLARSLQRRAPLDAANLLWRESDAVVAGVLEQLNPAFAMKVFLRLPEDRRAGVAREEHTALGEQLAVNQRYPEDSVGRLMEPAVAVFDRSTTVRGATARIRELAENAYFTYAYVVDEGQRLRGVVVMRDLLLADPEDLLSEIMVGEPFFFRPETPVAEAMRAVVHRHYPVYPVCDDEGHLLGLVQGYLIFEEHAFEISAQPGRMVGVEREEHLVTPWITSLKLRHPWLQLNLLTAFLAAFVVGLFESTIEQVVALAVFLPVLAGQSGNTGSQALAITIRAMTLNHLRPELQGRAVTKEAVLGLLNGALVGLTAGLGMFLYASVTGSAHPLLLALVVFLAMVGSCVASGVSGVMVPITLKRLGADPATASAIFLTTATDVVSMGMFLWLATLLVL